MNNNDFNPASPIKLFKHQEDYLAELQDRVQVGIDLGVGESESKMIAGYIGPDGEATIDFLVNDLASEKSDSSAQSDRCIPMIAPQSHGKSIVSHDSVGTTGSTGVTGTPNQSAVPSGDAGEFDPAKQSRGGRLRKPKGQRFSDVLNARILKERQAKLAEKAKKKNGR